MYWFYNQEQVSKKLKERTLLLGEKLMFVLEAKFHGCIFVLLVPTPEGGKRTFLYSSPHLI